MKIKSFLLMIIPAVIAAAQLAGATVWEGAAAVAPAGDLPDSGFYAATNSFPRNTVVDVTNLENGKSIRVIVAAGLETPGLLAVISRNAADMIGLPGRSVGRIRINQPADPVAFSRFTEGLASSGDPDYDPSGMTVDEKALAPARADGLSERGRAFGFDPESEWADDGYGEIVDLPENYTAPTGAARSSDLPAPAADAVKAADSADDESERAEAARLAELADAEERAADIAAADTVETATASAETAARYDYALLPADERPPVEPAVMPDESMFISPVKPVEAAVRVPDARVPDEGMFIDPLAPYEAPLTAPDTRVPDRALFIDPPAPYEVPLTAPDTRVPEGPFIANVPPAPVSSAPPETPLAADDPVFTAPAADSVPAAYTPPAEDNPFSVPLISGLEQGKYYVQLGSFSRAELARDELSRLGGDYPLAVQNGGSEEKPMYRVLLGPLNIGEGGAALQRFKSIGYKDAFLRQN